MIKGIQSILKSNRFLSLAANFSGAGFAFISVSILTRSLSKEDIGKWVMFLVLASFFDMMRAGIIRVGLIRKLQVEPKLAAGSAWLLGLMITSLFVVVSFGVNDAIPQYLEDHNYKLFTQFYGYMAVANLTFFVSYWIQQGKSSFGKLLFSRLAQAVPFAAYVVWAYINGTTIHEVTWAYTLSYAFSSLVSLLMGWCELHYLLHAKWQEVKNLFHFGKYTMSTALGTNLLKSSDVYVINEMLGPAAVAVYGMTYRIMELIEIPIRSLVATVLPKMASANAKKNDNEVRDLLYQNGGATSYLLIPILVVIFIFADYIPVIIYGEDYADLGLLLRVFCLFGVLIPIDRFMGIALDSIGFPKYNSQKVIWMVVVNVILDIAILYFFPFVEAAAAVTFVTASVGVILGKRYLAPYLPIEFRLFVSKGWEFIQQQKAQLK